MARVNFQSIPPQDVVHASLESLHEELDASVIYLHAHFVKVATDIENYTETILAPYHLSEGRFILLHMLRNAPEGMKPTEIAQQLGVTQATVSGLVNGLEKVGFATRQTYEKDARSFVIKVTEKGLDTLKEIFPKWYPKLAEFWGQLSPEEIELAKQILQRMSQKSAVLSNSKPE